MLLSEAIEVLIIAVKADGRSDATVRDYRQKLGALERFLGERPVDEITVDDLRRFSADLHGRMSRFDDHPHRDEVPGGLAAASVAGYVRAVKRLFGFLAEEGKITRNPAERLNIPKLGRGEPKACRLEDFQKLLAATAGDSVVSRRDRALLLFLADTGCRVGGLCGLRLADVDLKRQIARLTEKGDKTRWAPFSEPTREALQAWLAVRPDAPTDRVFVTLGVRVATPWLSEDGVGEVLRRLKARCGIDGPVNPHSFRHAFAREYLQSGGDLGTLADLLGHSDVNVTWKFYAIFTGEELAAKHARHSPIARLHREGRL